MKQLIKTEDCYALNDPLLGYLTVVSNHFWPSYDPYDYTIDVDGNQHRNFWGTSMVPEQFADKYFDGYIHTDREQKYLDSEEVLDTLKAFGLDVDKFWYLCLGLKDVVEGYTKDGLVNRKSPRLELQALEKELDKMEPEIKNHSIVCKRGGVLTLKVGKHPIKVTNPTTLSLLSVAIHHLLEQNKDFNGYFDTIGIDLETITLKPIYNIVLFNKYLSWFLKDKVADKAIHASKDKSLLISRMIFILGISDDESFFEEYREDGSKLNYLKNYIKKYKDKEVPTINNHYFF